MWDKEIEQQLLSSRLYHRALAVFYLLSAQTQVLPVKTRLKPLSASGCEHVAFFVRSIISMTDDSAHITKMRNSPGDRVNWHTGCLPVANDTLRRAEKSDAQSTVTLVQHYHLDIPCQTLRQALVASTAAARRWRKGMSTICSCVKSCITTTNCPRIRYAGMSTICSKMRSETHSCRIPLLVRNSTNSGGVISTPSTLCS